MEDTRYSYGIADNKFDKIGLKDKSPYTGVENWYDTVDNIFGLRIFDSVGFIVKCHASC